MTVIYLTIAACVTALMAIGVYFLMKRVILALTAREWVHVDAADKVNVNDQAVHGAAARNSPQ